MWTLEVYEKSALPPAIAYLVIAGSALALAFGALVAFLRARHRAALAAAAEASVSAHPPPLVEGADVVLAGVVRHFEDNDVAVRVRIRQRGSESESSGSWSHSWTEIDREIILAPFLLELADGQLVLVQPPRNVDVADALDQKVWINRNERVLSAELVPGEQIFARGRLARSDQAVPGAAYRDVKWGWALHPAEGQMLLSSEPLGRGLRERAGFHRGNGWLATVLLFAIQVTLVAFYARAAGHTEVDTVRSTDTYETTDNDGDTTYHWVVYLGHGSAEIDSDDYSQLAQGTQVPIRIAGSSHDNWALGASPTIRWWHGLLLAAVAGGFGISYGGRRIRSRPWFRRRVDESGSGKLPDPPRA